MNNSIGKLLKFKRMENNMTQNELCNGVCTPSYLSRIEKDKLIADNGTYELLFKKLGLNYESMLNENSAIDDRIEKWYEDMLFRRPFGENIEELKQRSQTFYGDTLLKYEIVHCRYLLLRDKIQDTGKLLNDLGKLVQPGANRIYFIYANTLMLYYYKTGKFLKAKDVGIKLININGYKSLGTDFELGVLYYNLALNYKNMYLYNKCIDYAKQALELFDSEYYLDRSISCHILLGIGFNNLGKWEKAIKSYTRAKRILNYLTDDVHSRYLGIINNDLGYCYECQEKYKEAIELYVESLEYKEGEQRLITIVNLIRCNYILGDWKSAKQWLSAGEDVKSECAAQKHFLQLEIFSVILSNKEPSIDELTDIQNSSITYFLSQKMWRLVIFYSKLFAHIYENHKSYKKANSMYKIVIEAEEKLLAGGD